MDAKWAGRIEEKLDRVLEQIQGIHVTDTKQNSSLDEHMRRTAALEDQAKWFHRLVIGTLLVQVFTAFFKAH